MKLSRDIVLKFHFFLDQCIPPIIRDSKLFMKLLFMMLRDNPNFLVKFKTEAFRMSEIDFTNTYKKIDKYRKKLKREVSLNESCVQEILKNIVGQTVLDVGCGNGYLAEKLSAKCKVTASDVMIIPGLIDKYPRITFKEANIERLPFKNREFDTVICSHTLEHVQNLFQTINELRRVTKKRLIIIVPKQRPYRYTFDLHLHFFPYKHSLMAIMGTKRSNSCREIGGDLFYIEDNK